MISQIKAEFAATSLDVDSLNSCTKYATPWYWLKIVMLCAFCPFWHQADYGFMYITRQLDDYSPIVLSCSLLY